VFLQEKRFVCAPDQHICFIYIVFACDFTTIVITRVLSDDAEAHLSSSSASVTPKYYPWSWRRIFVQIQFSPIGLRHEGLAVQLTVFPPKKEGTYLILELNRRDSYTSSFLITPNFFLLALCLSAGAHESSEFDICHQSSLHGAYHDVAAWVVGDDAAPSRFTYCCLCMATAVPEQCRGLQRRRSLTALSVELRLFGVAGIDGRS
jgi:hypothetical protein